MIQQSTLRLSTSIVVPIAIRLRKHYTNQYSIMDSSELEVWVPPRNFKAGAVREIVYVNQHKGSKSSNPALSVRQLTFSVKISACLKHRCRISETVSFCPECDIWNIEDGKDLTLMVRERPMRSLHSKHYSDVMILLDESVSFAVALKIGEHKYAGGDIIIPYKTQTLQAAVEYFYMMHT
jgi:flavoprotein